MKIIFNKLSTHKFFILLSLSFFGLYLNFPKLVFANSIVINEILPKSIENIEWVEIYNPTGEAVNLSGWRIIDGNTNTNDDLSLEGEIQPLGFRVFEREKGWLNDSGDESVTLFQGDILIDQFTYDGALTDKTFGRIPDGGEWVTLLEVTKNSSNGEISSTPPASTPTNLSTSLPSPTNLPTIKPSPAPTKIPSVFNITSNTSSLNPNESVDIPITITGLTPNNKYFLKGAFSKNGSTNYFGKTKVSGIWVKNNLSYSSQYPMTSDLEGMWSGKIEIAPDSEDSGFSSSGGYIFKVGRYTDKGAGPTWSNQLSFNLIKTSTQTEPTSIKISNNSTSVKNSQPDIQINEVRNSTQSASIPENLLAKNSTVAGVSTQLAVKSEKIDDYSNPPYLVVIGAIFVIAGGILIVYLIKRG